MKTCYCEMEKRILTREEIASKNHNGCGLCGRKGFGLPSKATYLLWRFQPPIVRLFAKGEPKSATTN